MIRNLKNILLPLSIFIAVLLLWELSTVLFDIPEYLLPAPSVIFNELSTNFSDVLPHLWITTLESFLGFVFGALFGWLIAVAFNFSSSIEKAFYPYAIGLKSIPIVALAPLLIVWLGNGLAPKIIIAAIISFFPVVVNVTKGFKSVDAEALDLFNSLSATKYQIFKELQIFNSLPYLFSALKISATLAVIGAIVGEFSGSDKGLGFYILISSHRLETVDMFIGIILASALGLIFFYVVGAFEKYLTPWSNKNIN